MQAWEQVVKRMPHARLELFGKGNDRPFQKLLSRETQRSVKFHGFATQEQIRERLQTAAAAVFPSFTECFSLAPMEAMASGCPVIYTQRSSGPELITHGVDGHLVEPANPNDIADAILKMLREPQYAAALGLKGRETIGTRFSPADIARQHIAFYQKVIDNYQPANA
jgi:glycosyltransferase involved in cell wall biosynthesis